MNWGDVDDSTPSSLKHGWKRVFAEVECRAEVERNDLFPLRFWEVDALINVLNAGVVDKDIDPAELLQGFINDFFAISWLGEICKDVDWLGVGVFGLEFFDGSFDFFIWGKPVKNDVVSFGS